MNWPETARIMSSMIDPMVVSKKKESTSGRPGGRSVRVVAQLRAGRADRGVDVLGGEPMHSERVHDPQRGGHVLRRRKRSLHSGAQHLCFVEHFADLRDGPIRRICLQLRL